MNTEHSFNIELAKIVGIEKAILLKNIHWWILKNAKNGKNYRKGKFWTFNSARAFTELFPYMNERSITRWLKELEDENWIVTENFNRRKSDKTKWYSLGDKLLEICKEMKWESIEEEFQKVDKKFPLAKMAERMNNADFFSLQKDGGQVRQNDERIRQNGESFRQNDGSIRQNGGALPDVATDVVQDVAAVVCKDSHDNNNNFVEELKDIDLNDPKKVYESLENLFEISSIPCSKISSYRILKEKSDARKELSKEEIWEIVITSFIEVSGKDERSRNLNYLIAKIRGKKKRLSDEKKELNSKL